MKTTLPILFIVCTLHSSAQKTADLIIYNAKIYTVDAKFSKASAMAVKNGKILETGSNQLLKKYSSENKIDANGKTVVPGLIDAHAHFVGYAGFLLQADLTGTKSWNEVVDMLIRFKNEKNIKPGEWIMGRGWDQNDWDIKEFPTSEKLDSLFPDNPVYLKRVDGHAAIVNQAALKIAKIKAGDKLTGGEIEVKNGKLTGILIDNATDLVSDHIPAPTYEQTKRGLKEAEQNCFAVGLTTVDDCGLDHEEITGLKKLQASGDLKMRIYAMLSDNKKNFDFAAKNGKIKTDRLNVCSFKVYADGALGSRGACLLEPYSDKPGWYGFLLSNRSHFDSVAARLYKTGWQMCTHAIGDSGNRVILDIYAKYLRGKNDRRWRIEHAQVVNKNDFATFGKFNVIPSVQPTHATSDMYWAKTRLGDERVKGAYAYRDLLKQNKWIPLGTDFPVEDISPFKTFYAAVVRKDASGWPAGGYQMENALTREQALRGMTIWAAKSNFEEKEKGSLEKGKFADFIILDTDLMTAPADQLLNVRVISTWIAGEKVYGR